MGKLERMRVLLPIQRSHVSGSVIVLYLSQSVTVFIATAVIYKTSGERHSLCVCACVRACVYIYKRTQRYTFAHAKEWGRFRQKIPVK
jgi:hypothetical protein